MNHGKLVGSGNPRLTAQRVVSRQSWRKTVMRALHETKGNVVRAAKALRISRTTLVRWIEDDSTLKSYLSSVRMS